MPKLAAEIWKSIFDELYSRAEFDWWWDGIEKVEEKEIRNAMIGIIQKVLDKHERDRVREVG